MQQVIEAAWITAGVGGLGVISTAAIGYLGFRNTRKATERTVAAGAASTRATLAAAREERVWEKRAAAYEETLAYTSNPVLAAFEASQRAHLEVRDRYQRWKAMADDNKRAAETGRPGAAHDGGEMLKAHKEINPALEDAEARDEALIKLIRDELRSVPKAAQLTSPQPGKSRRWPRRRKELPS